MVGTDLSPKSLSSSEQQDRFQGKIPVKLAQYSKTLSILDHFDRIALYFGMITCGAGIIGVLLGSEIARR